MEYQHQQKSFVQEKIRIAQKNGTKQMLQMILDRLLTIATILIAIKDIQYLIVLIWQENDP